MAAVAELHVYSAGYTTRLASRNKALYCLTEATARTRRRRTRATC